MTDGTRTPTIPDVDYLTRDYRGFREQLIQLITRGGSRSSERSAADLGMVVLEALAYTFDHLAYAGDRVSSEGYLRTARSRQSVRMHAALGDYVLDRGSTSIGFQHFSLPAGSLLLPAGVAVGPRLEPGQNPDDRDLFETTASVNVDARHNFFTLRRAVGAGAQVLWLGGPRREAIDLWSIGLRPGMPLALVSRDHAEAVTIAAVQGSAVLLAHPSRSTYIAGGSDRAAHVVGNLVGVRRGRRRDWTAIGRGGGTRDDLTATVYFHRRVALVQALAAFAERHRDAWRDNVHREHAWRSARRSANLAVCQLRRTAPQALSDALAGRIDELLTEAATSLRDLVKDLGHALPAELLPTRYVSVPRQRLALPPEAPPLWLDGETTLEVSTLVGGRNLRWTEVEDLLRSGPNDRHYVVEILGDRDVALRFGDGQHGAMPPPGAPILARWVVGDPALGDVGRGALALAFGGIAAKLTPSAPTSNPLATTGARPAEPLDRVADRLRLHLANPATPVTRGDYIALFEQRPDVVEAAVLPVHGSIVRVAVRFAETADFGTTLHALEQWADQTHLVGTRVRVSLARPLYVSVTAIVQVHPEAEPATVQGRCKVAVRDLFAAADRRRMGVSCTRSEVLRALESAIGVEWSDVIVFDRAASSIATARELVIAGPDELLRCIDDPEVDATGRVKILTAREYSLVAELWFVDPDVVPPNEELHAALYATLSGPASLPVRDQWPSLSMRAIAQLLGQGAPFRADTHAIVLRSLIRDDRSIDHILLRPDDVPLLRSLQLVPRRVSSLPEIP